MEQSTIAFIIIGVVIVMYVVERFPIALTSLAALMAFPLAGIIPLRDAFSGFGNDILFLAVGMIVLGNALFETGVVEVMGKKMSKIVGTNERVFIAVIFVVCTALSVFLANVAVVALMLPISASVIAGSKGKLTKKNTNMMVGIAAVVGGGLSIVGAPPQLIAQSILIDGGFRPMGFFEISQLGIPLVILSLIFFTTVGPALQRKIFSFPEIEEIAPKPVAESETNEQPKSVVKMFIAVGILLFCIIGFVANLWTVSIVSIVGAILCIATGCISQKRAFETMNWTTIIVVGCAIGIAHGFERSGASQMVADSMINMLGDNVSPWLLTATLSFIAMIFTNFMSSSAVASILVPIAILAANDLGYDVTKVVMITAFSVNAGFATPISTPPMTLTLSGGYRFTDYIKFGGLFNILTYALVAAAIPFILGF